MSYGNQHVNNSHHVDSNRQQYQQPLERNRMNVEQNQMPPQFGSDNFGHPYPNAPNSNNQMTQNFHNQSNNQIHDNSRLHNQTSHVPNMNTVIPRQYHQGYTPVANQHNHQNNNWSQQNNISGTSEAGNHGQSLNQNESTRHLQNQNMNGSQAVNPINSYSGNPVFTPPPVVIRHTEPVQHETGTWIPPVQTTEVHTNHTQQKPTEPSIVIPNDITTKHNERINSRQAIPSGQNEIVKVVPLPNDQHPSLVLDSSMKNDQGAEGFHASKNNRGLPYQNVQITVTSLPHPTDQGANRINVVQRGPTELQNLEQQKNTFRSNNWEAQHQSAQQAILQPSNGLTPNLDRTHQSHAIHSGPAPVKTVEPASYHASPNPESRNLQRTVRDCPVPVFNSADSRTFEQDLSGYILQPVKTRQNFADRGVGNGQNVSHSFFESTQQSNAGNRFGANGTTFPFNQAPDPDIKHQDNQSTHMPGGLSFQNNDQRGFPNNDHTWKQQNPQLHQQMVNHGFNHTDPHNQQAKERMHNLRQQQYSQNMMMMQKEEQQRHAISAMNSSRAPVNISTIIDPHLAEQRRRKAIYEEDLRSIPEPPMLQVNINNMGEMTGRAHNNQTNWTSHFSQQTERKEQSNRFSPYNKDSIASENFQRRPSPSSNVFNKDNQPIASGNGQNGQAATSQDHTFSSSQEYLTYIDQQAEERRRQRMLTPVPMRTEIQAPKNNEDDEIEVVYEKKSFPLSAELFLQQQQQNAMRAYQNINMNVNQFPNAMNQNHQQQQQHHQLHAGGAYGNVNQVQNPNQNSLIHHQHPNMPQPVMQYQQAVQHQQHHEMQKFEPAIPNPF